MKRHFKTLFYFTPIIFLSLLPSQIQAVPELTLPLYKLTIDQVYLDALNGNPWTDRTFPAVVEVEDETYTCRVRYRGRSGRDLPKKSWKIIYDDENPFGRGEINLNSEYRDRSIMRNHLAMELSRFAGQPAPDTRFVSLVVNDTYYGVFVEVEQVDEEFLDSRDLVYGMLWKSIQHGARFTPFIRIEDLYRNYEPKITPTGALDTLIARFSYIVFADADQIAENIDELVDIENLLYYFASQYVINNGDGYTKNFYTYMQPDGRWLLIPWDCDASLGNDWLGEWIDRSDLIYSGFLDHQAVFQRLIAIPEHRDRMLAIVNELTSIGFYYLVRRVNESFDQIHHDVHLDTAKRGSNAEFELERERLIGWLQRRAGYLDNLNWFNRREIISTSVEPEYISSLNDTFRITAVLPEIAYSVSTYLLDSSGTENIIQLHDDGTSGDETAGDLVYTCDICLPDRPAPFHYGIYVRPNRMEGSPSPHSGWALYYYFPTPLPAIRIDNDPPQAGDLVFTPFSRILETGTIYFGIINVSERPVNLSDCIVGLGSTYKKMQLRELAPLDPGDRLIITNQAEVTGALFPGCTITGPFCFLAEVGDTLILETYCGRRLSSKLIEYIGETGEIISKVVINEINYNSADDFEIGDWVELYCLEGELDISNWSLRDNRDDHSYIIPEGTIIHEDQYLVIARDPDVFSGYFPDVCYLLGGFDFGFGGGGDDVRLLDASGLIIDWVSYDDDAPWPDEADGGGATLELVNPSKPNFNHHYWGASNDSSAHGTPGSRNSIFRTLEDLLPREWGFELIYPNPFNSRLSVRWGLLVAGFSRISVFDIQGREVQVLTDDWYTSGRHEIFWKAGDLPTGMYFLRLEHISGTEVRKVIYLK